MSAVSNFAFVIARITKDVNLRKNNNGSYSGFIPLAEHELYKNNNGETKQRTNFISARAYLKTDKQVNFYKKLTKGKLVAVTGKQIGHSWKDSNNNYHFRQDFVPDANGITFLSKKPGSNGSSKPAQSSASTDTSSSASAAPSSASASASSASASNSASASDKPKVTAGGNGKSGDKKIDISDDDLPF